MEWAVACLALIAWLIFRGQQERRRRDERERLDRKLVDVAAKRIAETRTERESELRDDHRFQRTQIAYQRAGYDVPSSPFDERWQLLRTQAERDLRDRPMADGDGPPDRDDFLKSLERHSRGLRRLNRIRQTLGVGKILPS